MKTQSLVASSLILFVCLTLAGQTTRTIVEGRPASLRLSPHLTTTIRLPEPVNSVVVGDPSLFQAEYSADEPMLVFVKPLTPTSQESNLVISTVAGRQFIFTLKNLGVAAQDVAQSVDLFVNCRRAGVLFIEDTFPAALVSETLDLKDRADSDTATVNTALPPLDEFVTRQHARPVGSLTGDDIRVGIGEVQESGSRLVVSFSVVNSGAKPIEVVPPQVQLANQSQSGLLRRTRWNTVQQLPVDDYRITSRRVAPGERVDSALSFERPSIKQSHETLFLQIADSAAIDRPTLAPISFRATTPTGGKL